MNESESKARRTSEPNNRGCSTFLYHLRISEMDGVGDHCKWRQGKVKGGSQPGHVPVP